jgi:hypothetical protein
MADKYPSRYSNGKSVSAAQYITEIICENKAKQQKEDLHYRFWVSKKWASYYRNQIASANKLVKQYDPEAIVKALKSDKAKKIYSLRAPHLIAIIEEQAKILESQNTNFSLNPDRKVEKTFSNTQTKKSILSKLKELDNE